MTSEQVKNLKLGIPLNDFSLLIVESALTWVLDNTTLEFDITNDEDLENLPANVRLFAVKYHELMTASEGVTSESIEGLSQSFNTSNKSGLIWQIAESLLAKWLKSPVSFVPAVSRWA